MIRRISLIGVIMIGIIALFAIAPVSAQISAGNGKIVGLMQSQSNDTLEQKAAGDSIVVLSTARKFSVVRPILKDYADTSTAVDSCVIEAMAPDSAWYKINAKNLLTGNTDQLLVPGNGNTCAWEVTAAYCKAYRVRRINTVWITARKTIVQFEAFAP